MVLTTDPGLRSYQQPPDSIRQMIEQSMAMEGLASPDGRWLAVMRRPALAPMAAMAQQELRLAGMRFDASRRLPSGLSPWRELILVRIDDGQQRTLIAMDDQQAFHEVQWSPDATRIAWLAHRDQGVSLCAAAVSDCQARTLIEGDVHALFPRPYAWQHDGRTMVCRIMARDGQRPPAPAAEALFIQESDGKASPSRTYPDLLQSDDEADLFAWYARSQVAVVGVDGDAHGGGVTWVGEAGLIRRSEPSPDGRHLLVEVLERPFSQKVPVGLFAYRVEVWREGGVIATLARVSVGEGLPVSRDAARPGRRSFSWRVDQPATLIWAEASPQDDVARPLDRRDTLYQLDSPFDARPSVLGAFPLRYQPDHAMALNRPGVLWGDGGLALVSVQWHATRTRQIWRVHPDKPDAQPVMLWTFPEQDRYHCPGEPVACPTSPAMLAVTAAGCLWLAGQGASAEGDQPFVDEYDPAAGQTRRLWQSQPPAYEQLAGVVDVHRGLVLTLRESCHESPNYYVRDLENGSLRQLTYFPRPYPSLEQASKRIVRYQRRDGLGLHGALHLPPGCKVEDGPFPLVIWAYPAEFLDPALAQQVQGSPCRYPRMDWQWVTALPLVSQGYAVLDRPAMPIVGSEGRCPNDRYVQQLVDSAQAAVEEMIRLGITRPGWVAVMGHSYGGFMTANLLAHCDLFSAGIACSGAYNRTLTPFGFQGEERTLWQASQTYVDMSPFMHADQINAPLLLVHGQDDENEGTFPMQSQRMYAALQGHGKTCRLVMMPRERHRYAGKESVGHLYWEITQWLRRHLPPEVQNPGKCSMACAPVMPAKGL